MLEANVGDYIKKKDHYYLDGLHKDHPEVFNKNGNIKNALNLDGTLNVSKSNTAIAENRSIKDLL